MLEQSGLGLFVNNFYAEGFLHADDIRTLITSTGSVEGQVMMTKDFAASNGVSPFRLIPFCLTKITYVPFRLKLSKMILKDNKCTVFHTIRLDF